MIERQAQRKADAQGLNSAWLRPSVGAILGAAVLLVAGGFALWRVFLYQSEITKGLDALKAAYKQARPFQARISGLTYAPWVATRGSEEALDIFSRDRAERILLDAVFENQTSESYHALGKLYLAAKQFEKAIAQLERALKASPTNADVHSDYAVALFEAALRGDPASRLDAFARSLEHLKKALSLDGSLREALFNRALLYETMGLQEQARDDWKEYIEREPHSEWSIEARHRLRDLDKGRRGRSRPEGDLLAGFLRAYQSRNDDEAFELISENTDAITGKVVWWQLLGAYLEQSLRGEVEGSNEYLNALFYGGELMRQHMGDPMVLDLAQFYRSITPHRRASIAQAHMFMDEAHALLARSQTDQAIDLYEKGRALFDATGDQVESCVAGYWIGYSLYRKSDFTRSRSALLRVGEYSRIRGYLSLVGRALTMIANLSVEANQFSASLAEYREALEISRKISDQYNAQKNLTSMAYVFKNLGNRRNSLAYMQESLEVAKDWWPGARQMYRNYDTAAGILNAFGFYTAAAEYERAALQFALEAKDPAFEHLSYMQLAAIHTMLEDYGEALRCAERSYVVAREISNIPRSLRPLALSSLRLAHIYRQTRDYDKAAVYYDGAITICREINLFSYLYEAHKGRLLCYVDQGDDSLAEEELRTVLALFEEHRAKIKEETNRNSFFDLEQYVYDIAIDFEYSRKGDFAKAFDYSEVSRARSLYDLMTAGSQFLGKDSPDATIATVSQPLSLNAIREKLPDEVQLLEYSVLENKLLIWLISRSSFEVMEQKISSTTVTDKALSYWRSLSNHSTDDAEETRRNAMELCEVLLRPVEQKLDKDKQICIIPDKALNYVPFNALVSPDTGRFVIEDYLLSFAPSANAFLFSSDAARERSGRIYERVLSVGDPRFNRDAFPGLADLPSAGKEAEEVYRSYRTGSCLVGENAIKAGVRSEMAKADVIHLASHYVIDEHNPMLSKLLLSKEVGGRSSDDVLHAYDIYLTKLPVTRLVTLSACQTGVEHYYKGEGMIGMSRTFLAAGVPLVVASLWPVDSDATATLMISFHKYRREDGLSSAAALRRAQLDIVGDPKRRYNSPYYWAPFITIGGYAAF